MMPLNPLVHGTPLHVLLKVLYFKKSNFNSSLFHTIRMTSLLTIYLIENMNPLVLYIYVRICIFIDLLSNHENNF